MALLCWKVLFPNVWNLDHLTDSVALGVWESIWQNIKIYCRFQCSFISLSLVKVMQAKHCLCIYQLWGTTSYLIPLPNPSNSSILLELMQSVTQESHSNTIGTLVMQQCSSTRWAVCELALVQGSAISVSLPSHVSIVLLLLDHALTSLDLVLNIQTHSLTGQGWGCNETWCNQLPPTDNAISCENSSLSGRWGHHLVDPNKSGIKFFQVFQLFQMFKYFWHSHWRQCILESVCRMFEHESFMLTLSGSRVRLLHQRALPKTRPAAHHLRRWVYSFPSFISMLL